MKKITIILLSLYLSVNAFSQDDFFNYSLFYTVKKEYKAKKLQKRFDKAAIYRDYFYQDGYFYMELDESDYNDNFEFFNIEINVIKKRHKKRIETLIMLKIDDTNTTIDQEIELNKTL